ncbi:oxygen-independent coproporphyrinogen III oxidase [Paroceanicella profunda]|uniref:Coproporphyrinogen-III oxidase n=1 Tax=Paroceanicella profunda TaxID=2579971 RepID=A0A5B8FWA3_9RHOB|nr:oxygen-independent coproporphyrinogen III oxidase [Paroceanicella profunda]QDL91744.1 oxygen-independent coproporphyrinogen III oxidase [Paroceanicella profunda]
MTQVLARYATERAPRYTSYPTAPQFTPAVDGAVMAGWLSELDPGTELSLYLHVPFCRQVCWYCACNMKLAARPEPVLAYAETLKREISRLAELLPARMRVSQVHWGGGTPTAMPAQALGAVMDLLQARFDIGAEAEIAFELDPRTTTPEMVRQLAGLGATRASLGVQEFDAKVQAAVNRVQPFGQVRDTVEALRAAGVGALSFDLIYGLPHQSPDTIAQTMARTAELAPGRVALFGYAHVPWMARNQRMLPEAALPDAAARVTQATLAAELLERSGYLRIGLDHFARPEDSMAIAAAEGRLRRNFQGYTVDRAGALIGLGASAISALPQGYAQNAGETRAWTRGVDVGLPPVVRGVALTPEDRLRGAVIERLMCDLAVTPEALARRHGFAPEHFAPEMARLRELARDGLVHLGADGRVTIPPPMRPALRLVAAVFDAYLPQVGTLRHAAAV